VRFPLNVPPVEAADWETNRKSSEDEFERSVGMTKDELWALEFLQGQGGTSYDDWKWQPSKFLTGKNYVQGLEAFLRLLASKKPMAGFLRRALIDLFAIHDMTERKLSFVLLKDAPLKNKEWAIAYAVDKDLENQKIANPEQKPKVSAAVKAVKDLTGLSEKTIWNALSRNKKVLQK